MAKAFRSSDKASKDRAADRKPPLQRSSAGARGGTGAQLGFELGSVPINAKAPPTNCPEGRSPAEQERCRTRISVYEEAKQIQPETVNPSAPRFDTLGYTELRKIGAQDNNRDPEPTPRLPVDPISPPQLAAKSGNLQRFPGNFGKTADIPDKKNQNVPLFFQNRFYGLSGTAPLTVFPNDLKTDLNDRLNAAGQDGTEIRAFLTVLDNKIRNDNEIKTAQKKPLSTEREDTEDYAPRLLLFFGRPGAEASQLLVAPVAGPLGANAEGRQYPNDLEGIASVPGSGLLFLLGESAVRPEKEAKAAGEVFVTELEYVGSEIRLQTRQRFNLPRPHGPKEKTESAAEIEGLTTATLTDPQAPPGQQNVNFIVYAGRGEATAAGDKVTTTLEWAQLIDKDGRLSLGGRRGAQFLELPSPGAPIASAIAGLTGSPAAKAEYQDIAAAIRTKSRAVGALAIDRENNVYAAATFDSDEIPILPDGDKDPCAPCFLRHEPGFDVKASWPLVGGFLSTLYRVGQLQPDGSFIPLSPAVPCIEFYGLKVEGLSIRYEGSRGYLRVVSDDEQPGAGHTIEISF